MQLIRHTVVSIPNSPSTLVVKESAWYDGLVQIVEPKIFLDGDHSIGRTFEVAQKVWVKVFYYLAVNNIMFKGILLKPCMVTPAAKSKHRATPQQVADYTLEGFSGGQSEVEATLNLNSRNQGPNPLHVSSSYTRVFKNACLKISCPPRPTHLLSLASISMRKNQKRPRQVCQELYRMKVDEKRTQIKD
uniref:fructose-bisphosphate aldolase n=1 Tax=Manihot esculenta TaxID=3983 RepID=A0A2C9UZK4_MANES